MLIDIDVHGGVPIYRQVIDRYPRREGAADAQYEIAWMLDEEGDLAGLINLVGIESPGLTCAPALAEHVGELLLEAEGP